ncbi:MAG: branched-chain amino acid ABC transporter permease [Ilumatobacter sp.]|uniref:branched-chain amino acid ABC transporter permease n=1 Tax=Ilumatobacter sp. TaxID=1967498 RepID=UPI003C760FA6
MANTPRFQIAEGSTAQLTYKWVGIGLFVLFLVMVAFAYNDTGSLTLLGNDYTISTPRLTKAIAFIICILGLQVVAGFTGQLSLGQGFFFGTGAYLAAWLVADHNWSWFATLAVVVPVCFLLGMIVGVPALRIRGLYLALVTLGLAAVFPSLIQLSQLQPYTNGAGGKITDSDLKPPDWLPLDGIAVALQKIPLLGQYFGDGDLSTKESDRVWVFFLMVVLTVICFKLVGNLINSRPGRALRAIRDNETSAAVTGMNLSLYKTLSFGLASALGGVGGIVYVAELGIAAPGDFTQLISIYFIVGLVVGGVGTLWGAVIGGLVITFIPDWAASTEELPGIPERWLQGPTGPLIMGVLLIVLTFVLPGGVVAGTRKLKAKILRIVPRTPDGDLAVDADADETPDELGSATA